MDVRRLLVQFEGDVENALRKYDVRTKDRSGTDFPRIPEPGIVQAAGGIVQTDLIAPRRAVAPQWNMGGDRRTFRRRANRGVAVASHVPGQTEPRRKFQQRLKSSLSAELGRPCIAVRPGRS